MTKCDNCLHDKTYHREDNKHYGKMGPCNKHGCACDGFSHRGTRPTDTKQAERTPNFHEQHTQNGWAD
jgi:hypothetical protein